MRKKKKVPFCPVPIKKAEKWSERFSWLAEPLSKTSPNLPLRLKQAGIPYSSIEYTSLALFSSIFMGVLIFAIIFVISLSVAPIIRVLSVSVTVSIVLFFLIFIYVMIYPRLLTKRKVADIERNLLYSLKHILIQIKSGVPLFEALVAVSEGNYGQISEEFKSLVKDVDTGTPLEAAMDSIALRNPAVNFRRAIWQISNGMKAGSDVGDVLGNIIDNISKEQLIGIRKYGSQLNPLTLIYMMIAVIIPALGVTMLIVLSSFSGFVISEFMFFAILGAIILFQFMYIGIIKSKRPNI
jgi:flagellar protein FlaJ